jgi:hypothetical protein
VSPRSWTQLAAFVQLPDGLGIEQNGYNRALNASDTEAVMNPRVETLKALI